MNHVYLSVSIWTNNVAVFGILHKDFVSNDNLWKSKFFEGILQWSRDILQFWYSVAEVSVDQDGWCNHGPEVDGCSQPGGDDLHPHRR